MSERSKSFLQESQEFFEECLNERKAILRQDINKEIVKSCLMKLLVDWEIDSGDYEEILKAQKNFLSLSLIYHSLSAQVDDVNIYENLTETTASTTTSLEFTESELTKDYADLTESGTFNTSILIMEFEKYCYLIEKDPINSVNIVKTITDSRRIKSQLLLITWIISSLSFEVPSKFEQICSQSFSKEEIFIFFNKILPKPYNYNLYMKYYQPFLQNFIFNLKDEKLRRIMISAYETFSTQFPQFSLGFNERYEIVMKKLGMESFNLEDCCDRIETRASVMSLEAPTEMAQKMFDIWLLCEASKFLVFDDNCMVIYVFSSELSVFHEQIMRIFYILNRIDEVVRDVGYASYGTPTFISFFTTIYIEMHCWFVHLVRALTRNFGIIELESNKITGKISRKSPDSAFIAAKLNELCVFMTCPLASLDSTIRLGIEITENIPILFGDEEEKFLFTTPTQNILVLHDFVASDRENFAKHVVELYPCLDRHFSRFHKSKKTISQGPNLSLPPSYHLFAKCSKPPEYELFQTQRDNPNSDLEAQDDSNRETDKDGCFCYFLKKILVGILFCVISIVIIIFAIKAL